MMSNRSSGSKLSIIKWFIIILILFYLIITVMILLGYKLPNAEHKSEIVLSDHN